MPPLAPAVSPLDSGILRYYEMKALRGINDKEALKSLNVKDTGSLYGGYDPQRPASWKSIRRKMEPATGIEPATASLQMRCSTD